MSPKCYKNSCLDIKRKMRLISRSFTAEILLPVSYPLLMYSSEIFFFLFFFFFFFLINNYCSIISFVDLCFLRLAKAQKKKM